MYVHLNILEIKNKEQVFLSLSLHEEKQKHNIWMIFSPKNFIACEVSDKNQSCGRRSERNRRSDSTPRFSIEATNVCINSCVGVDDWSFFFFGKLKGKKKKKEQNSFNCHSLYSAVHNTIYICPTRQNYKMIPNNLMESFVCFFSFFFFSLPPPIVYLETHGACGKKKHAPFCTSKTPSRMWYRT